MPPRINLHELANLSSAQRAKLQQRTETDLAAFVEKARPIMEAVRLEGDEALARFARVFEKAPVTASGIAATEQDFDEAEKTLDPKVCEAMEFAAHSIRKFHQHQMPDEMWLHEIRPGAFAGDRARPIPSVACYIPRGKGAFPSVALMTSIPAKVAGVKDVIIVTPPGTDGKIDDATLVAARMAGVSKVFKAGGAQAIAAVAYGTQTVPKVAKVIGPGSPWVAAAKRLVSHVIDTGSPAGPSEVVIFADDTVDGALAGLDLLIEAEHGPDSSAYLVTWSRRVAEEAMAAIPDFWKQMGEQRVSFSSTVLGGPIGGVVLARDEEDAIAFCNEYASGASAGSFKRAFRLSRQTRECRRDPAGRTYSDDARQFRCRPKPRFADERLGTHRRRPISVFDFLKRNSIAYVTSRGYPELARHARVLATYEGFEAHANAVSEIRDRILKR